MPSTIDSLAPIFTILNKALELGELTLVVESKARATRVRQQIYEARGLDKSQSRETYTIEDERYDKSPYDRLAVQIKPAPDGERYTIRVYVSSTGVTGILEVLGPDGLPLNIDV